MRIAVCAPQVPFVRGGAEIFADTLVDELRAREHEAELVTIPFKWYPGTRVLDQAFLWRLLDLEEADGRPDRPRRRDEVPLLLRPPPEQARLGAAPVPAGVRARPNRSGPVLRRTVGPGVAALGPAPGPDRARRGEAALRDLAQRRRPDRALDRARGRGDAAPAAGAALPLRRATATSSSRSTGSTARSGSTCCSRRPRSTRRCASCRRRRAPTASGSRRSRTSAG